MITSPFHSDGAWLRCAFHAHTTNSDGDLPPAGLVGHYETAGFDVLAITDHWIRTEEPSTERLLVLLGTELNAQAGGPEHDAHVLALGIEADPERPSDGFATLAETVDWVGEHGGVAFLAHTYWSGLRTDQFEACPGLVGLEVWNAGCELEVGRGDAGVHWDEALERGRLLFGIAVDDSHHPGYDSALAWVWARCAERSREAVLSALREGRFYSSTGPTIDTFSLDDGAVVVRCSPAASVTLLAGRRRGARANAGADGYLHRAEILETDGGWITRVRLERPRGAPYGRVEVTGVDGTRAWTNPLWSREPTR